MTGVAARDVLILGDSIPFPRFGRPEFWEAWPQRLHSEGAARLLWMRASGASTAVDIAQEADRLHSYLGDARCFDVAIVQVGIVDCCPRPVPRWLQGQLDGWGPLRPVARVVRRSYPLLLRVRSRPWIPAARYRSELDRTVSLLLRFAARVVLIEILPAGSGLRKRAPGIQSAIEGHNRELRELAAGYDSKVTLLRIPVSPTDEYLLPDGHHLTSEGHRIAAAAIIKHVNDVE